LLKDINYLWRIFSLVNGPSLSRVAFQRRDPLTAGEQSPRRSQRSGLSMGDVKSHG
jgi:hypothetical protein